MFTHIRAKTYSSLKLYLLVIPLSDEEFGRAPYIKRSPKTAENILCESSLLLSFAGKLVQGSG